MDLFTLNMENNLKRSAPLAQRMRPRTLEEFVGQSHIVGKDKYLYRAIKSDLVSSMIFYGPPGVGKTTLAEIVANTTNKKFHKLSAVTSNLKELREILETCEEDLKISNSGSILFLDEIHRFNKAQQDALLPFVERGIVTLIGATTENPYFEVNKALLSRCKVINLKELKREDLLELLDRALKDEERGLGRYNAKITEDAKEFLVKLSSGDGRFLLNSIEMAVLSTDRSEDGSIKIDVETIQDSTTERFINYDKNGNEHYNIISAFIKSMRGSDPNAALIYMAAMLNAGEDPKFILRRMLIFASEDIGNANPMALSVATSGFYAFEAVGMPEGRIILGNVCTYLASSPKSNASYLAIDNALRVTREHSFTVPMHLRDPHNPSTDKVERSNYKYPHSYEGGYVEQQYLPDEFKDLKLYNPTDRGFESEIIKYFKKIGKDL